MTDRELAELLALLEDTPHDEVMVETGVQRGALRRMADGQWVRETTTLRAPVVLSRGEVKTSAPKTADNVRAITQDGLIDVRAPLPGIFYRAPKPGAAPFVEIGTAVTGDTVVGIIETMKLMNSVPAGVAGQVAEICLENGAPVEAQDVVARVRPERP